jgi:hypothetical protein
MNDKLTQQVNTKEDAAVAHDDAGTIVGDCCGDCSIVARI